MRKSSNDWGSLKLEFLKGPWKTVEDFRKYKGWKPRNEYPRWQRKTVGWAQEKEKMMEKALANATEKIVQEDSKSIQKIRERQANLARWLQLKGAAALKELNPTTVEEARKLVITGLREERAAIGINIQKGGGATPSLTQVNVNLPKTNFDKLVEGMSYEEILGFIAEIKRERIRRLGEANIIDGAEEVKRNGTE